MTHTGGREPTTEERAAALERDHADLRNELDEAKHALRQQGTAIGRVHTQAMEYADERDRALRTFISSQLESGVGRTLAGVAFSPWA